MRTLLQNVLFGVLIVLIVVGVVTILMGREQLLVLAFGPIELTPVDFKTLTLTERPNQYLLCPASFCTAQPDAISPVYPISAITLRDKWWTMVAQQPRVQQIHVSPDGLQFDFRQRSRIMRFPDSITVRFIPLSDATSTLAIYSRSHYGYSDFGVNRQRVEAWLAALQRLL